MRSAWATLIVVVIGCGWSSVLVVREGTVTLHRAVSIGLALGLDGYGEADFNALKPLLRERFSEDIGVSRDSRGPIIQGFGWLFALAHALSP